jgi:Thiamine pyrophosphate enzyme, C-terminal TPP binding domain
MSPEDLHELSAGVRDQGSELVISLGRYEPRICLGPDHAGCDTNLVEKANGRFNRIVSVLYGNVARDLEAWGGEIGTDLQNPDFMKVADAYGVIGLRAKDPMEAGGLLKAALEYDAPVLLEVPVGTLPRPPFFPVSQPHPRFGGQAAR